MTALAAMGATIIAFSAWIISASALLCVFTAGNLSLFVFPFDQWIQAVRWFKAVGWLMKLAIVGSGAVPTIILALVLIAVGRALWGVEKRPSLYGNTGWAGREEREQFGIGHSTGLDAGT